MRRSDAPYLFALGLLILALGVGLGISSETHTTYINGSRVQSPAFNATGNVTINDTLRLFGNGSVRGAILDANTRMGGNLSTNGQNVTNITYLIGHNTTTNPNIVIIMPPNGCLMIWNATVGNDTDHLKVQICDADRTGQTVLTLRGSIAPDANNTWNSGVSGQAWKENHAVTQFAGDINFGNGFKIVESLASDESDGIPKLYFIDNKNNTIMAMGGGSIYIKGAGAVNLSRSFSNKEYDKFNLWTNTTRAKAMGYKTE